jgi:hypothetical protein
MLTRRSTVIGFFSLVLCSLGSTSFGQAPQLKKKIEARIARVEDNMRNASHHLRSLKSAIGRPDSLSYQTKLSNVEHFLKLALKNLEGMEMELEALAGSR